MSEKNRSTKQVPMSAAHKAKAVELLEKWGVPYEYNEKEDRYEFNNMRDNDVYHVFAVDTGKLVTAVYVGYRLCNSFEVK